MLHVINRLDPTFLALGSAGLEIPLPHQEEYQSLWETLGQEGPANPVLTILGGKGYLPKLYQQGGAPVLQWGTTLIRLSFDSKDYSCSWDMVNTGYQDPCIVITQESSGNSFPFPVALRDNNPMSWVLKAARKPEEAVLDLMVPDPCVGHPSLTETYPDYRGECTVVGAIVREGKDFGAGKTQIISALVKIDPLVSGGDKLYVVRGAKSTAVLGAPSLKTPMNLQGIIGATEYMGTVYQRLTEVFITREDLNI